MKAPRIVHSRGTVQSKTGVPDGVSIELERDLAREQRERLADAGPGQAARQREELAHQLQHLRPARGVVGRRYPS